VAQPVRWHEGRRPRRLKDLERENRELKQIVGGRPRLDQGDRLVSQVAGGGVVEQPFRDSRGSNSAVDRGRQVVTPTRPGNTLNGFPSRSSITSNGPRWILGDPDPPEPAGRFRRVGPIWRAGYTVPSQSGSATNTPSTRPV
jgi:hypothetical protein